MKSHMTDARTLRARRTGTSSVLKERARTDREASRRGGNVSGPLLTVGGRDLEVSGWGVTSPQRSTEMRETMEVV